MRTLAETLPEISLEEYTFQMFEYKLVVHGFMKTQFLVNVRHCPETREPTIASGWAI